MPSPLLADGVIIDANESWAAAERKHDPDRPDGVAVHTNYLDHHRQAAHQVRHVAQLVEGLESVLAGHRKLFEIEYDCGPPDELRWFLMSVRYVLVTTAHCDRGVQLSVEDVGTGIAPDQLGSVFEPFFTTKATGLGLGLALCRSIVQAHDGQLTAENNAVRGVTFRCTLPLTDCSDDAKLSGTNGRGV